MNDQDEVLRAAADAAEPPEIAVARVIRRAERTLDRPPPRRRHTPLLAAAGIGAAVGLGGSLLALQLFPDVGAPRSETLAEAPATHAPLASAGPEGLAAPRPDTPDDLPSASSAAPTDPSTRLIRLASDTPTHLPVGADVSLVYTGRGTLDGGATRHHIAWEAGELGVEVIPARGVDLVVETPEGSATVVGTGFSVTRNALGTRISVTHGTVAVRCRDGREARLGADTALLCLPVRAAGMLARARALDAAGADTADVLDALEAGLRLDPEGGPVRAELAARRIDTLAALGRDEEAAAAAAAWLASGETLRRAEVRALAIGLALRRGDCAAALALHDAPDASLDTRAPALDPATTVSLAGCADPARALLEAARAADADHAARIDARSADLPNP